MKAHRKKLLLVAVVCTYFTLSYMYNNVELTEFLTKLPMSNATKAWNQQMMADSLRMMYDPPTTTPTPEPRPPPLAVLFTSFSNRTDKLFVYENTIRNWASLMPVVQPLLFTTFSDGPVISLAKKHGWIILPNPSVNKFGSPYLRAMYTSAFEHVNATMYGFANGDILFDNALITTLQLTNTHLATFNSVLIYGTRWNYMINNTVNYTATPIWPPDTVKLLANKKNSTFFRYDAYDYFIIDRRFPLAKLKNLVIARSGFDTYLVAMANKLNRTTIAASKGVSALHQTDNDGNFAHNRNGNTEDKRFNRNIIGRFNYSPGLPGRVRYSVNLDKQGQLMLECKRCLDRQNLH